MRILITPGQKVDPGILAPTPDVLQKQVIAWAHTECRRYHFGYILTQYFRHRHYQVYFFSFLIEEKATVYAHWGEPTVALQATLNGIINGHVSGDPNSLPADTIGLFYLPPGDHEVNLEKGFMESMHIELHLEYVEELTEDWPGQQELINIVKASSSKSLPFQRADMNYLMRSVINRLRETSKTGSLLKLEFKSSIAELLKLYLHEVEETRQAIQLDAIVHKDKEALINIWRSIKANPNVHLHHLTELARKYYLHPKTLSRNFGKLFGSNLRDFVLDQCMKKGYYLITTTKRNINEIAEELGYLETKSFNRAFQRQFKITPQSLRYNQYAYNYDFTKYSLSRSVT